jgi:Domain of unknown function (DUF4265)
MTDARGSARLARVIVELEVDDDGWPPVSAERLWAVDLGDDLYRLDNAPWFAPDLAVGDILRAVAPDLESHRIFLGVVEKSEHLTIRLICFRIGPLAGDLQAVVDIFVPLGVYAEGVASYGVVALDVPAEAQLRPIYTRLAEGLADGSWEWEEGRINGQWSALSAATS